MLDGLLIGFSAFSAPPVWIGLLVGALTGYLIGAIPGLGPALGVSLLIPFTYGMDPVVAIVAMVALYSAAEYGGAITAILINAPGTASNVATSWDGYPLTQKGKASIALQVSIISSGVGILISATLLPVTAIPLSKLALLFGPSEYFALALAGLTLVTGLSEGAGVKGVFAMFFGLALATVGLDSQTAIARYAYSPEFYDGLPLIPVLLGLYALSQVLFLVEGGVVSKMKRISVSMRGSLALGLYYDQRVNLLRSSVLGYVIGVVPGAGSTIASFIAYGVAKGRSKTPEEFGKGSIEGIAASEAANNAAVSGAMAPLLALGIPGSATSALMLSALMIQGLQPGPMLFTSNPEIPYTIFVSLFVGVPMMVLIGLAGSRLWARVAEIPPAAIAGSVAAICAVGAYSSHGSIFPVYVMIAFGLVGYVFRKAGIPLAPIVLALVLGEMLESNFRRALVISRGSLEIFYTSPITMLLLVLAVLAIGVPIWRDIRGRYRSRVAGSAAQGRQG